jgi:hypothetical protein
MTSRRSIMLGLVFGAFLGVFGLNSVYAQVPRSISYQGLLVKNNQPVNGMVNIHVKIYDAAGQMLYEESYSQQQVTNGIFNVLLGGPSGTLTPNLKFDEQYYLGIDVDGTGEVTPRTPFVAAPYALNSQTVGGVGVSVTPQAGMLLPLDANGKLPKSVLPLNTLNALTKIDGMDGDANGNITIKAGVGIASIVDDATAHTITINAAPGGGGIQTIQAGPGLTGGGSAPGPVTVGIAQFGITNGMLGTGVVTGLKIDQNVPQWGLYQDQVGNLNVGLDNTLLFTAPTRNGAPVRSVPPANTFDGIGLNLANPNTWTGTQTFSAVPTGIIVNTNAIFNGNVTMTPGILTINGTPEPSAPVNGATAYEITDNGDALITGTATIRGNTFIGAGPTNTTNTIGNLGSQPTNSVLGLQNNLTATSAAAGAATNNIVASGTGTGNTNNITASGTGATNNIQANANNIGTTQASGNTNTIGNAGNSVNTVTGSSNTITATAGNTITAGTTNSIQAPTNNIGTTNANSTNTIGNAGTSSNTVTGSINAITGTSSNNIQAPTNNIGTTNANSANTIGNAGTSTNIVTGNNNTITGTGTNSIQAPTINEGTTQVAGGTITIGTLAVTTTTINGLSNSIQAQTNNLGTLQLAGGANNIGTAGVSTNNILGLTDNLNATNNNIGTSVVNSVNTIGFAGGASINTFNGTSTFNGNTTHNGNITQTSGTTTLLTTQTGNLTVVGTLTQSGGNAQIAGGATNNFGTVANANNTIGGSGATNTVTGGTNTLTATVANNISGPTNTITGNTTATGGTFTSTGNSFIGTTSTTNVIGNPGNSTNTITGQTNSMTATTGGNTFTVGAGAANNFTGDIVQASGRASLAPTASTVNNFVTGASSTANIGTGAGDVINIGTSATGAATTTIGNLNAGTATTLNGPVNVTGGTGANNLMTVTYSGDQNYLRVAGGLASCAGAFPTSAQSELLVNGDIFADGTLAGCRLNVFGVAPSCITNLNTTNFGSCSAAPINLLSSILGVGSVDMTNMNNIQANGNIKANTSMTVGNAANATTITPAAGLAAAISVTLPSVAGGIPTFQTYTAQLVPATGPQGGGSVNFWNTTGAVPVGAVANFPTLKFDAQSNITVTYRSHNLGVPAGALYVTTIGTSTINVESSAANDNNQVQISVLRP